MSIGGARSRRPLRPEPPLLVADMSLGALSEQARVRGISEGQDATSPAGFEELHTPADCVKALTLGCDGIAWS